MKVHELITMLQQYDSQAEVVGTREGVTSSLDVYQAADGCIMVDTDGCIYKVDWQETKCEICGEPARGTPFTNKGVCYEHWNTFKEEQ